MRDIQVVLDWGKNHHRLLVAVVTNVFFRGLII
uniref:Uncharacterized protein n=1 Tax=Arundo donax TaxID=35708 RepID=A0A0A9FBZ7_ARUDO